MKYSIPHREFHISFLSRKKYEFEDTLFSLNGNVIFANFHAARVFAHKMNSRRDLLLFPEQAVKAGDLYAMGLIDEILHYLIQIYRRQVNPAVMEHALSYCRRQIGNDAVDLLLQRFVEEFPASPVYLKTVTAGDYLADPANPPVIFEEMLMLWIANQNSAFSPFDELFGDTGLSLETRYDQVIQQLRLFFESQPFFGPGKQSLIDILMAPAKASPHSLTGQLDFIRSRWGALIQDRFLYRLLSSLDFIREENKSGSMGPGPVSAPDYMLHGNEVPERFSPDLHWMPNVVMMAKNAHVWLDQLSKQTGRSITRLDQIPDETLQQLSAWGFTTLWLIGVWERSHASKKIKQMMGNPEAEASAYALYDYQIAAELGGEAAFMDLKRRAWAKGIRMAGDMVPNHVGIDGRWVIQHPDWFVSLPYSPFPSYTFNGADLSPDDRIGIYIEDHYYNRSDAAVVFRRKDHWTGEERFIYHGNDGTSMPWNDTAQLNFLNPEVREAVIQTILHVARQFPVIRFDAAMTLTQKHFQRLWFPEPGHGGDIASRAQNGLSREAFLKAFPVEFWREVVDRVAAEAPGTLLLAEAFWLLEGYFVRTLGMHRVYNSAFMNMLKTEDNAGYRDLIRKTLEFNPEILKRFVNFMNNPDEDTAVAQFGRDDKYFGVCLLMATMPGLPMFGHGQIEGLSEKYGMEYRRAYWDESPDEGLISRHEHEVFPVLRKRYLFAEVAEYCLYDVFTPDGQVNPDVYAHSNRIGDERALFVFHNTWAEIKGRIGSAVVSGRSLGEGLGLNRDDHSYTVFRDHISGLEYIRNTDDFFESGLYIGLGAFKYQLFWEFRQVRDEGDYRRLAGLLNGRGVPSIDEAFKELGLKSVMAPFQNLLRPESLNEMVKAGMAGKKIPSALSAQIKEDLTVFYEAVKAHVHGTGDAAKLAADAAAHYRNALQPLNMEKTIPSVFKKLTPQSPAEWLGIIGRAFVLPLGQLITDKHEAMVSRSWIDELLLAKMIQQHGDLIGLSSQQQWESVMMMKILTVNALKPVSGERPDDAANRFCRLLFSDPDAGTFLQLNRYHETLYFNKEKFGMLMRSLCTVTIASLKTLKPAQRAKALDSAAGIFSTILTSETSSGYEVEKFIDGLVRKRRA